ncbi:helix-turn-helix transcriptional regulator [Streptomyces sp. NPDC002599]|uniref:helix-turn-helix domain-containing protein n=1 Tax=Streptomyces sp. NPDC002599 TaxID=3154421 RepID=UPI00332D2599
MEERVAGNEFAGLLGELKQRSGLSYGVLAKRLHVSTSTLHRYVNGDAVPTDYAPVERLARACRATPEELVELHRRWVLADALRGQTNGAEANRAESNRVEANGAGEGETSGGSSGAADGPDGGATDVPGPAPETESGDGRGIRPGSESGDGQEDRPGGVAGGETGTGRKPGRAAASVPARWSRRAVVLAGAGAVVAAAIVSTALTVRFGSGAGEDDTKGKAVALGAPSAPGASRTGAAPGTHHGSASASPSHGARPRPTGSTTAGAVDEHGAADGGATGGGAGDKNREGAGAPNVVADAYKWDSPCSQHYLVNRDAPQVPPPPPNESDARGWVTALGGVASGEQMIALTVQGTGRATVVLEALHVRVVQKGAPLAWNDYVMGVGCGGGVETKSFTVDLDAGSPATALKGGQRDFPYKVSESDPEVFYVFADARAHDVSWYLEIDWSSGTKSGTVRVDDHGKPFRTSGNAGRPAYEHPLGSSEWVPASTG